MDQKEKREFTELLTNQRLGGRWLPENPEVHYTFAGEVPWCDTFPATELVDIRFLIKEREVKARRRLAFSVLDGQSLGIDALINLSKKNRERVVLRYRVVEVQEVEKEFRDFGFSFRSAILAGRSAM